MTKDELNAAFAERLNQACDEKGVAHRGRASVIAGWVDGNTRNPTAPRNWINGRRSPHRATVLILARHLDVRPEWLEFGTPPMHTTTYVSDELAEGLHGHVGADNILSQTQADLLKAYHEAPPAIQDAVRKLLDH